MYGIEFMSFVYLVVYIGAIAILFLFIIMMLNLNSLNMLPTYPATISFFLYTCIFLKTVFFIFLVNKNLFLSYLDSLNCPLEVTNYHRFMGKMWAKPVPDLWLLGAPIDRGDWLMFLNQVANEDQLENNLPDFDWGEDIFYFLSNLYYKHFFLDRKPTGVWWLLEPRYDKGDFGVFFKKEATDLLADHLISGIDSASELACFCLLYNIYIIHFILAGFILLFAMLGSISLCLVN